MHGLTKFTGKVVSLLAAGTLLFAIIGSITSSVIPGIVFVVFIIALLIIYFLGLGKCL
ncbi:hypothetical protein [Clostridium yunnanense]|uniref:hypothetical protein n=1 Tax=Clostridium yunnanense TaxID=2800325 RepID=UPI003B847587